MFSTAPWATWWEEGLNSRRIEGEGQGLGWTCTGFAAQFGPSPLSQACSVVVGGTLTWKGGNWRTGALGSILGRSAGSDRVAHVLDGKRAVD